MIPHCAKSLDLLQMSLAKLMLGETQAAASTVAFVISLDRAKLLWVICQLSKILTIFKQQVVHSLPSLYFSSISLTSAWHVSLPKVQTSTIQVAIRAWLGNDNVTMINASHEDVDGNRRTMGKSHYPHSVTILSGLPYYFEHLGGLVDISCSVLQSNDWDAFPLASCDKSLCYFNLLDSCQTNNQALHLSSEMRTNLANQSWCLSSIWFSLTLTWCCRAFSIACQTLREQQQRSSGTHRGWAGMPDPFSWQHVFSWL